jgi:hypothetical protein
MSDSTQQPDFIDLVIKIAIFASFVVFGFCMWLLKREMNKKKAGSQKGEQK